ncbi:hypothetical protein BB347_18280 (plasmid) [Natronorubrum daqingense]|nr:hypothetical protein BB347_18280 [Natronorubrum daqingense]
MYPASKLVYLVLDREGPLTTKELATETHLTRRTVNQHTKYLRQADYVNSRPKLLNPNENVHALADRRDGTSTELGTELNTVGGDHDGQ